MMSNVKYQSTTTSGRTCSEKSERNSRIQEYIVGGDDSGGSGLGGGGGSRSGCVGGDSGGGGGGSGIGGNNVSFIVSLIFF